MSTTRPPTRSPHYKLGLVLILVSALVLSTFGFGIRHVVTTDGWQILFYRSISFTLTLLLILAVRYRGRLFTPFRKIGRRGAMIGGFLATASSLLVFSVLHTTIANTLFVVSTMPFIAAALGWVFLRERVAFSTWIAMIVALIGVLLMVADGLQAGGLLGILLAGGVAVCGATMLVTVRGAREIDMIPALALAGLFTAGFTVFMVADFEIPHTDLFWIFALGSGQYALGFALLVAGTRYVPVAEVTLLSLIETVLGPVWVWLAGYETPSRLTISGGLIVLGAAVTCAIIGIARSRAKGYEP